MNTESQQDLRLRIDCQDLLRRMQERGEITVMDTGLRMTGGNNIMTRVPVDHPVVRTIAEFVKQKQRE